MKDMGLSDFDSICKAGRETKTCTWGRNNNMNNNMNNGNHRQRATSKVGYKDNMRFGSAKQEKKQFR